MPRKKLIRCSDTSYYVTIKSSSSWFYQPLRRFWKIACESLTKAEEKYPVSIHAFVLMSNHYHLVLDTPDSNIDKFMYEFNKNFSLALRKYSKKGEATFKSRYRWCLVEKKYISLVLRYIAPTENYTYKLIARDCIKNEISPLSADERAVIENGLKKYILKIKT